MCHYVGFSQIWSHLISCTTPVCFSAFYRCAMVPTLVENSIFFPVYLFVNFFVNNYYDLVNPWIVEPHSNYRLKSEVSIMLHCQLFPTWYTAFQIKNCSKSTSAIHVYRKKEMVPGTPVISIIFWKVKYPLHFVVSYVQPVTQQYKSKTVQKTPLKSE